jgi:hypothetical protein
VVLVGSEGVLSTHNCTICCRQRAERACELRTYHVIQGCGMDLTLQIDMFVPS